MSLESSLTESGNILLTTNDGSLEVRDCFGLLVAQIPLRTACFLLWGTDTPIPYKDILRHHAYKMRDSGDSERMEEEQRGYGWCSKLGRDALLARQGVVEG